MQNETSPKIEALAPLPFFFLFLFRLDHAAGTLSCKAGVNTFYIRLSGSASSFNLITIIVFITRFIVSWQLSSIRTYHFQTAANLRDSEPAQKNSLAATLSSLEPKSSDAFAT